MPRVNKLEWLVRRTDQKEVWVGFVRLENGGAYLIGGPTGSHATDHGESWSTKYSSLLAGGYLTGGVPRDLPRVDDTDIALLQHLGIKL